MKFAEKVVMLYEVILFFVRVTFYVVYLIKKQLQNCQYCSKWCCLYFWNMVSINC